MLCVCVCVKLSSVWFLADKCVFSGKRRDGNDEKWSHSILVAHGNGDTGQSSALMRPQSYCRDEMRVMSVGRQDRKALFIGTFA